MVTPIFRLDNKNAKLVELRSQISAKASLPELGARCQAQRFNVVNEMASIQDNRCFSLQLKPRNFLAFKPAQINGQK
jgi:hypothetical protein